MRTTTPALLVLALLAPSLCAQEKKPAAPKGDPALELPEPQKVEPATGFVKVQAKATGPVSYFLSAVWDDGTQAVQYEVIGGILILGIPNHEGIITIVASTNGAAGQPPVQKSTTITIERKAAAAKKEAPVSLHATVIGTVDPAKLAALADAGVKLWTYALGDPRLSARPDLTERQQKLGGGACVIVSDAQGEVVLSQALPATGTEAAVLGAVQRALKGGK